MASLAQGRRANLAGQHLGILGLCGHDIGTGAQQLLGGCAGYQIGTRSLFPPNIRTVFVPVFESDAIRRNLGERLTEAVVKELEQRAFKVVRSPNADSTLRGQISTMHKRVLGQDVNGVPRNLEVDLQVQVTWTDRVGQILLQHTFTHTANFVPEAGQSISTAQQMAIQRTARQIVSRMEMPW